MRLDYKIYVIEDTHGNKCGIATTDSSDIVMVYNIYDESKKILHFESDAYHLENWCKENRLIYKEIDKSESI